MDTLIGIMFARARLAPARALLRVPSAARLLTPCLHPRPRMLTPMFTDVDECLRLLTVRGRGAATTARTQRALAPFETLRAGQSRDQRPPQCRWVPGKARPKNLRAARPEAKKSQGRAWLSRGAPWLCLAFLGAGSQGKPRKAKVSRNRQCAAPALPAAARLCPKKPTFAYESLR